MTTFVKFLHEEIWDELSGVRFGVIYNGSKQDKKFKKLYFYIFKNGIYTLFYRVSDAIDFHVGENSMIKAVFDDEFVDNVLDKPLNDELKNVVTWFKNGKKIEYE